MQASAIASSWLRTRRAMRWPAKRLSRNRERLWRRLQPALGQTPALAKFAGRPLGDFPITEIADMRGDYGRWNSLGLSEEQLRDLADASEHGTTTGAISAGWSSGTSGANRGLFVSMPRERADYIGQSLARLLPARALLSRQRLALHLRAGNALYSDVGNTRFGFMHLPLEHAIEDTVSRLNAFDPTILIAPPHRLIDLAEKRIRLPGLRYAFCGSEPISRADRDFIVERLGIFPRSIYQATEGFLGAECDEGRLHLNDHALAIELEPVPGTDGFRPIITDMHRTSQPIVRVRGDDFVELSDQRCPCGYRGRVIAPPHGRVSDIWHFDGIVLTPRDVVETVERVIPPPLRWQAVAGSEGITLRVEGRCSQDNGAQAASLLSDRADGRDVAIARDLTTWVGPKRRKVVWHNA